jgi:hypothetical protein
VKKLSSRDDGSDFMKEIEVLRRFRHPHIIKLHGFSRVASDCCLVYELGSYGSLANALAKDEIACDLTYKLRVRVMSGVAKALHYMHKQGGLPVFHRDVKSGNIVLDGSRMEAKLIDCGLSTLLREEQVQTNQTIFTVTQGAALGTPAYMCPDFGRTRKYGERSEVYSFGVVLLEIITGRVMSDAVDLIDEHSDNEPDAVAKSADARSGTWPRDVSLELAGIALDCIKKHKNRTLADAQKEELERLRLLARFEEAATGDSKRSCVVCMCEWSRNDGVTCNQGHFICDGCFSRYVEMESQLEDTNPELLRTRGGRIFCPIERHEPSFTEKQIALHASEEAYAMHAGAQQRVLQHQEYEKAQAQFQDQVQRMADQLRRSGRMDVGPSPEVLARQFKALYPNARMCGRCGLGPVDHMACSNLRSHHGERRGHGAISNACSRCNWFADSINDWPLWDGKISNEVER